MELKGIKRKAIRGICPDGPGFKQWSSPVNPRGFHQQTGGQAVLQRSKWDSPYQSIGVNLGVSSCSHYKRNLQKKSRNPLARLLSGYPAPQTLLFQLGCLFGSLLHLGLASKRGNEVPHDRPPATACATATLAKTRTKVGCRTPHIGK